MELNIIFGCNIKYFRHQNKLTQEKLAEKIGKSFAYVSQLELGKHSPSFETLESLSKVLKVEPHEFYIKRDYKKLLPRVDMY